MYFDLFIKPRRSWNLVVVIVVPSFVKELLFIVYECPINVVGFETLKSNVILDNIFKMLIELG